MTMNAGTRALGLVRKHKWGVAVALAVMLLVGYSVVWRRAGRAAGGGIGETAIVTRGPLDISIEAKGSLEAAETANVNLEISGRAKLTFIVPDGTQVKKGELLAKMDSSDLDEYIASRSIEVERNSSELTRTQESLRMKKADAEMKVAAAKLKVDLARMALDQYGTVKLGADGMVDETVYAAADAPPKGEAYQKFRDQALGTTRAVTSLERAGRDAQGIDVLETKGFITRNERLQKELAVIEAERNLESAKLAYEILKTYTYPQESARLRQSLSDAQNDFRKTELNAEIDVLQAESAVKNSQFRYDRMKADLDKMKDELAKREVKAPVDGMIIYGDGYPWSKSRIAVGKDVYHGMRLFTIPNTASIMVRIRVLEIDVFQVKVGQAVRVSLEALEGVNFPGKVSKVAEYATSSDRWGKSQDTKVFEVEVKFDQFDERNKAGMSCTAEILLDSISETTYVPVLAVFRKENKQVCHVVNGKSTEAVEVKTGRSSEKFVEILEGLKPGQKVLVAEGGASEKKAAGKGGA